VITSLLTQRPRAILLSSPSTERAEAPRDLRDIPVLWSSLTGHMPDSKSTNRLQRGPDGAVHCALLKLVLWIQRNELLLSLASLELWQSNFTSVQDRQG